MRVQTIIPRRGINDDNKGKKNALYRLISSSTADYVWLQDDDVVAPSATEEMILGAIGDADLLILPLRMEAESEQPSLLEQLQIAEYAAIQQLTIEAAVRGHAVMCSGANLVVKRERWLESYKDLHPEIASGDDMFLLESFKKRGLKVVNLPISGGRDMTGRKEAEQRSFCAVVRPERSWRALLRQRMRWAGKAPAYKDRDIVACGAAIALANGLQLVFPPLVLVKFPVEFALIRRNNPTVSAGVAFLLEVFYPIYMLICLIGGVVRFYMDRKKTW